VNFVWPFTKLTCKNYFSNNLQEVKWVIWIYEYFLQKKKKRIFVILWKTFLFYTRDLYLNLYLHVYFNKIDIKNTLFCCIVSIWCTGIWLSFMLIKLFLLSSCTSVSVPVAARILTL
jgi:hypothetical protein